VFKFGGNSVFKGMFHRVRKVGYTFGYIVIQMDVRILQISPIGTDFFYFFAGNKALELKKIRTNR
jgi:hypothetical protein